ncbi:MAG: DUF2232 domain-containing protein [Hyphomicrobiaceae bacterium]
MTTQSYLLGVGAGFVAAFVFASATTGPLPVRFILFVLTPLPIFLAGLGWGYRSALVAGLAGAVFIAMMSNAPIGVVFAITQALPCVVLCYLAHLNRPAAQNNSTQTPPGDVATKSDANVEWYPVGRLVLWAAALSAVIAIAMLLVLGGDMDALKKSLRSSMEVFAKQQIPQGGDAGTSTVSPENLDQMTDIALRVLPAIAAISIMASLLFNLWLAARITLVSGNLSRPWPDLSALTYPPMAALALSVSILASFLSGTLGIIATAVSGACYLAYVLLGLAILHHLTRGHAWRPFALWAAYLMLIFNMGLSFIPALVGLAEPFSPINRGRGGGPPGQPPNTLT